MDVVKYNRLLVIEIYDEDCEKAERKCKKRNCVVITEIHVPKISGLAGKITPTQK